MPLPVNKTELYDFVSRCTFQSNGDVNEQKYYSVVTDLFPRSEEFWKLFIIPSTNRIEFGTSDDPIRSRAGIVPELQELASIHYSIFLNLVYAHDCFLKKQMAYFENFYAHLSTVLDLVNEFLFQVYFLQLKSKNQQPPLFNKIPKEEFLRLAEEWYERKYEKAYQHYFSRGKTTPTKLITVDPALDTYFNGKGEWNEFKKFDMSIRTLRNQILHNKQLGHIIHEDVYYIPSHNQLLNYLTWESLSNIDKEKFKKHFIVRDDQMHSDFDTMKNRLNALWQTAITTFNELLYTNPSGTVLAMYNLEFVPGTGTLSSISMTAGSTGRSGYSSMQHRTEPLVGENGESGTAADKPKNLFNGRARTDGNSGSSALPTQTPPPPLLLASQRSLNKNKIAQ
jgi:hypothetical protein